MQPSRLPECKPFRCISRVWSQSCFPRSPCFQLSPSSSAISLGVAASKVLKLWELAFTFGGQKSLMAVTFLVDQYGRRNFYFTHAKQKTKNAPNSLGLFPYHISPPVIKFWTNHQSSKQNITIGGSRDLYRNLLRPLIQHIRISIVMTIKVKDTFPSWNQ